MAIVKGPALSLQASGNLGSICYSSWRSMNIARGVWTGTYPGTTKQIAMNDKLIAVSQHWGASMSAEERETWKERAKNEVWRSRLGDAYIPTGFQLFMKWNIRRKVMGLTIMQVAPGAQEWVEASEIRLYFHTGVSGILVNLRKKEGVSIEGYGVEYDKAGPYNSGGRLPIGGEWRFLRREVPPDYYIDYNYVSGKYYWYRARAVTKFGGVQNWFEKQVHAVIT